MIAALLAVAGVAAVIGVGLPMLRPETPAAAKPATARTPTPTPTPTPLTPAQALLAQASDPNACAVSFDGDGIALAPVLQTHGALFDALPIPARPGFVFAGWYRTAQEAASRASVARVNGAQSAACTDRELTLHGAWMTPDENAASHTRVPILMYHQFTTKPEGERGWLRGNYAYIGDFEAQMRYLADQRFYLPTWDELDAFIDGRLFLPARSVIITDDDADATWLELAVPVVTEYRLLTTSFVITKYRHEGTPSPYVLQRSHTDDMHEAGANGKGRMVNWTVDQIAVDLESSAAILGAKEVMAYPYGHYDATAKEGVHRAGFTLARTIDWGFVEQGTDKLALPVIRIDYGDTVDSLRREIG
nr:polysaccharide deacetylase family protein [Microbacterium sp. MAH-37]